MTNTKTLLTVFCCVIVFNQNPRAQLIAPACKTSNECSTHDGNHMLFYEKNALFAIQTIACIPIRYSQRIRTTGTDKIFKQKILLIFFYS